LLQAGEAAPALVCVVLTRIKDRRLQGASTVIPAAVGLDDVVKLVEVSLGSCGESNQPTEVGSILIYAMVLDP
jgi:hypothetical protein